MNGVTLLLLGALALACGYLFYGRHLAKTWGVDVDAQTPAFELQDGVDYVPTEANVVFGHQFASIAGAGPINGPIQAALFGWVPVFIWLLVGGIFVGGVQDFSAMYASVKNKGKSIGYLIEKYIGKLGKRLFLLFCWLFSILVCAAFADVVAGTFKGFDAEGAKIMANGAVATTSLCFIVCAVALGFFLKYTKFTTWVNTFVAIALLVLSVVVGLQFPIFYSQSQWLVFIFAYVLVASVTPVWALLQPRDYLNSYLLIAMMVMAFVGILVYNPEINLAAFNGFVVTGANGVSNYLFPTLFVTIACGAVSGFHALVSSGTSSKQIKTEKAMLPISYGSMLLESFLAIISLICIAYVSTDGTYAGTPSTVFATAIASFLTKAGLGYDISYTLVTLAVSAFGLTSLDSVARIGRLSFQEFFQVDGEEPNVVSKACTNKYVATLATLLMCYLLSRAGYASIWPLFGAANQLLSALALIACAVFFKNTKRRGSYLWVPMVFMLCVTLTALTFKVKDLSAALAVTFTTGNLLQLVLAVLLMILGVFVAVLGIKRLVSKDSKEAKAEEELQTEEAAA